MIRLALKEKTTLLNRCYSTYTQSSSLSIFPFIRDYNASSVLFVNNNNNSVKNSFIEQRKQFSTTNDNIPINNNNNNNIISDIHIIQNKLLNRRNRDELGEDLENDSSKSVKNQNRGEEILVVPMNNNKNESGSNGNESIENGQSMKQRYRFKYIDRIYQIDALPTTTIGELIDNINDSTLFGEELIQQRRIEDLKQRLSPKEFHLAMKGDIKRMAKTSSKLKMKNKRDPFIINVLSLDGKKYCNVNLQLSSFPIDTLFLFHERLSTVSYASHITYKKAFEELFLISKIKKFEQQFNISEEKLSELISSFENELAICHPQMLRDLQIDRQIKYKVAESLRSHIEHMVQQEKGKSEKTKLIQELAELKYPHKWFPEARQMKRKFILHVGPTNSGKTFNALERLKSASSGVYCGPLRLLAQEIYDRMNDGGVKCNLLTGQQSLATKGANHLACTIEMASTSQKVDVAVIDEFQMIADLGRGWAWTRAILGIPAQEVHLCGDNTAISLIEKICETTGDTCEVKYYDRLAPLSVEKKSVDWRRTLRKGDCVISFSRREILETKSIIERSGLKCAVVYGALPPEARANQAQLFNNPESGYDVLVASDAVGMGLNLSIRRVVFSTIQKFDGIKMRDLTHSEVKQIAGRAGRYRSEYPEGFVGSTTVGNIKFIQTQLDTPNVVTERAGIFPQEAQLELFSRHSKASCFSELLSSFFEYTNLENLYFMEDTEDKLRVAKMIDHIKLPVKTKYTFIMAPMKIKDVESLIERTFVEYCSLYSEGELVPHMVNEPYYNSNKFNDLQSYLSRLEESYSILDLYLWLSQRFQAQFHEYEKAYNLSLKVNQEITETLIKLSNLKNNQAKERKLEKMKKKRMNSF